MLTYKYIEAPNRIAYHEIKDWERTVFLAGSITGATNWQAEASYQLNPHFNIFNPRRKGIVNFPPEEDRIQIPWEYDSIEACKIILFYFSSETLAPITLFELGKVLRASAYTPWKKVYICIHPDYKRKNDVIIQTELENIEFAKKIRFDLGETLDMIIEENA